jgi:hypothetical protein
MSLLSINSQDEPAVEVAAKSAIIALLTGIAVSIAARFGVNDTPAISVLVTTGVGAVWLYVQGHITRGKVFAPATVAAKAPEMLGWPTDVQLPPELTFTDVPINR